MTDVAREAKAHYATATPWDVEIVPDADTLAFVWQGITVGCISKWRDPDDSASRAIDIKYWIEQGIKAARYRRITT